MRYFDRDAGLLDRVVFSSKGLYADEQRLIFRRCWLFVGPENWAAAPGDFFTSSMGETPVLVWRAPEGALRVFVNECVAGFQALTRWERGNAETLACACHGWTYIDDQPHQHARQAPLVAVYRGLVFASFDQEAGALAAHLGDFAWYLDMLFDRRAGGVEACGGASMRWLVDSNWKVPAEAFAGDAYRDLMVHAATHDATGVRSPVEPGQGMQISAGAGAMAVLTTPDLENGAAALKAYEAAIRPEVKARLGMYRAQAITPLIGTLFPNLSFDWRTRSLHVWHPRGPAKTEIQTWCFADRGAPPEVKEAIRKSCQLHFGPAGLQSQDDVGPWQSVTTRAGQLLAQRAPLNLQMGLGHEISMNIPGRVSGLFSEMNQRSFFAWWEDRLDQFAELPGTQDMMPIGAPTIHPVNF
jgi:hypothetical protein